MLLVGLGKFVVNSCEGVGVAEIDEACSENRTRIYLTFWLGGGERISDKITLTNLMERFA